MTEDELRQRILTLCEEGWGIMERCLHKTCTEEELLRGERVAWDLSNALWTYLYEGYRSLSEVEFWWAREIIDGLADLTRRQAKIGLTQNV